MDYFQENFPWLLKKILEIVKWRLKFIHILVLDVIKISYSARCSNS